MSIDVIWIGVAFAYLLLAGVTVELMPEAWRATQPGDPFPRAMSPASVWPITLPVMSGSALIRRLRRVRIPTATAREVRR